MILNDRQIRELCVKSDNGLHVPLERPMIAPFWPQSINRRPITHIGADGLPQELTQSLISFGLSSFGYDATLGPDIKIFTDVNPVYPMVVDPKRFDQRILMSFTVPEKDADGGFLLPAHSFMLGFTQEYFIIPDDVMVVCLGKSTYARCGLIVNVTPLEPGWEGQVTLEISNTTPLPARVYPLEGVAQFLFFRGERPDITYADRKGKYQKQRGVTIPR